MAVAVPERRGVWRPPLLLSRPEAPPWPQGAERQVAWSSAASAVRSAASAIAGQRGTSAGVQVSSALVWMQPFRRARQRARAKTARRRDKLTYMRRQLPGCPPCSWDRAGSFVERLLQNVGSSFYMVSTWGRNSSDTEPLNELSEPSPPACPQPEATSNRACRRTGEGSGERQGERPSRIQPPRHSGLRYLDPACPPFPRPDSALGRLSLRRHPAGAAAVPAINKCVIVR